MNQGKSMPSTRNTKKPIVTPPTAKAVVAKTIKLLKATEPAAANAPAAPALPKAGNQAEEHALQSLQDFFQSAEYSKPNPIMYVYSQEKAVFIRNFLKVANLRAKEKGKLFKFVTVKSV
jgi:hypothetical protein